MAHIEFVNAMEVENELEVAGWLAAVSTDTSNTNYEGIAKYCIKSNHGTPTRAMRFLFEISGTSRACGNELVRHEVGFVKVQRSQRYVMEDGFDYVTPKTIGTTIFPVEFDNGTQHYTFAEMVGCTRKFYEAMTKAGIPIEDARYVLTTATHTVIRCALNWEALKNFCERRCCTRAQWEIREIAYKMRELIKKEDEFLGSLLGAPCENIGYCNEKKCCGKFPTKKQFFETYNLGKQLQEQLKKEIGGNKNGFSQGIRNCK